jgi:SAM-dependent methyltransferase
MWTDVVELRDFYASRLGRFARRVIATKLREFWPELKGERVVGIGYPVPFLRAWMEEAERVLAFMPAAQGVFAWPPEGPGLVALVDEIELPLPDRSADRILLIHAVEHAEQIRPLMREAWRVLTDAGRLIVVVPNRRGLWARIERSPFAQGHPYSHGQLARMLRDCLFAPTRSDAMLYAPPMRSRMALSAAPAIETLGGRFFQPFAGCLIVEAAKQLYVASAAPVRRRLRVRAAATQLPRPVMPPGGGA